MTASDWIKIGIAVIVYFAISVGLAIYTNSQEKTEQIPEDNVIEIVCTDTGC